MVALSIFPCLMKPLSNIFLSIIYTLPKISRKPHRCSYLSKLFSNHVVSLKNMHFPSFAKKNPNLATVGWAVSVGGWVSARDAAWRWRHGTGSRAPRGAAPDACGARLSTRLVYCHIGGGLVVLNLV